jgi:phospholipase/lecithinase/hemolysin
VLPGQAQVPRRSFSNAFNTGLGQVVSAVSALLGIRLRGLDANGVLTGIVANPVSFGLTNVDAACLTFGVVQNPFCRKPNDYLFWDGIHPTKAGHAVLASAAVQVLTAP